MQLSKYQQAVDSAYSFTKKDLVISAGPGCGKSFTLVRLLKNTPPQLKTIFLAFNKSISEELKKKVPIGVKVSTLHSLGMGLCIDFFKQKNTTLKVVESKLFVLAQQTIPFSQKKNHTSYLFQICSLIDTYRIHLCNSFEEAYELSSIVEENLESFLVDAKLVFKKMEKYNKEFHSEIMIDFIDMLYLPITFSITFPKYSVVFIDEVQDLSKLQKKFIDLLVKSGNSRTVVVGDIKQTIYSFQGASLSVFNSFKQNPNSLELPLSISYRCSKKIVEEANKIFPGLESAPDAEDGEVRKGDLSEAEKGDFILCRNNLPLVEKFLELLVQEKPAVIYGRDLQDDLIKLLEKIKGSCILQEAFDSLDSLLSKVEDSLIKRGCSKPKNHPKYVDLQEKINILRLLIISVGSVDSTFSLLERMFSKTDNIDFKSVITLMTIHKSKGLEASRVFFLMPSLIPSKFAQTKEELYSEKCLYYVALTRAKKSLIYLTE